MHKAKETSLYVNLKPGAYHALPLSFESSKFFQQFNAL